jgi:hypothetical protein
MNVTPGDAAELDSLDSRPAFLGRAEELTWTTLKRAGVTVWVLPLGRIDRTRLDRFRSNAMMPTEPPSPDAALRIALATVEGVDGEEILEVLPKVDVILLSRGDTNYRAARRVHETIVAYAPAQGQYLGRLRVHPGGPVTVEWLSLYGPGVTDHDVSDRIAALNLELRGIRKAEARQRAPAPRDIRWVGTQACESCHRSAVENWRRSGHARAMATLVNGGRDFDPDCLRCHVTAWGDGYVDPLTTPQLADVQCEACHGPGAGHVQDPSVSMGATPIGFCLRCHTKENSPEFDEEKYRDRIRHW